MNGPEQQQHGRRKAPEVGIVIDVSLILDISEQVHPNDGLQGVQMSWLKNSESQNQMSSERLLTYMNMKRNMTVATLNNAGSDHKRVAIMSLRPLALGTNFTIRSTRSTRSRGKMVRSEETVKSKTTPWTWMTKY